MNWEPWRPARELADPILMAGIPILYYASGDKAKAWTAFRALAGATSAVVTLKALFPTPRPSGECCDVPSGHTAAAVALTSALWSEVSLPVKLLLTAFSGYVAWASVASKAHTPDAVLAGGILGLLVSAGYRALPQGA